MFQNREQFSCGFFFFFFLSRKAQTCKYLLLTYHVWFCYFQRQIKLCKITCVIELRGKKNLCIKLYQFHFLLFFFFPLKIDIIAFSNWSKTYSFFCSQSQLFCCSYTLEAQLKISIAIFNFIWVDYSGSSPAFCTMFCLCFLIEHC